MKKAPFLPVLIGTGFGSGFSPFAPGTAGALLASIIWIALYFLFPFSWVLWLTAALVIVFTFAGIWAADKVELFQIAETFKARVIDYGKDSLLLEFVQTATKNDAVIKLIKEEFKNIEVVRGGSVGIESISMMER